ncbi:zinc finger SWIM domain-containing protein 3-like [Littorina saxatilis]|uniref:zinc finger SWIM domain-containing protein 3-like n=1 Tax=Littorina saxatilis TaxID=31220 RepID=UPI0038B62F41
MLSMKDDKKLIQQHVRQEYEKSVTLKDLHNLDGSRKSSSFNVETVVEELRTSPGAVVEVVEREGVLDGIFFQKQEWLDMYKKYPEILLIDATYKVNDLKMPLYIMLCIDGNGQSQIIALWIKRTEDRLSMQKMVQLFKKHHNVAHTRCVMADTDWVKRDVVKEEMPNAYLLICLFHTLRTFRREVTEKKMNITSGERQQCLRLLQEMAYADSEEAYQRLFQELQEKKHPRSSVRHCELAPH